MTTADHKSQFPRWAQRFVAHCRPQPALPALLVLLLTSLGADALEVSGSHSLGAWILAGGLLLSAGLAVAAGFCSFTPPLVWLLLAPFLGARAQDLLTPAGRLVLWFSAGVLVLMLLLQGWRAKTRRFVPTPLKKTT